MNSFLDQLQKNSHAHELSNDNTPPKDFIFFSIIQVIVISLIAWAISPRFVTIAIIAYGSHWFGFIVSQILRTNMFFDLTEDVGIAVAFITSYLSIQREPSTRQMLCFAISGLWCLRLASFVFYRIVIRGSDWRFDKLIKASAYNFFGWTSGGTWVFINGLALWGLAEFHDTAPIGLLDILGLIIWLLGFSCECISDIQKYKFNAKFRSGTNKKWIASGLWKYSRHPNYLGEIILTFGLSLIAVSGYPPHHISWLLCVIIPPFWSFFFLMFTSLMLLEKRADAKWSNNPLYQQYKIQVPVLFPYLFNSDLKRKI